MDDTRFDELIWLNRNKLVFMIEELEVKNAVLEKKLTEALNGTLLKRYNEEKEDALEKLKEQYELGQASAIPKIRELESKNEIMAQALKLLRQNLKWDAGNFEIINEALKKIEGPKF